MGQLGNIRVTQNGYMAENILSMESNDVDCSASPGLAAAVVLAVEGFAEAATDGPFIKCTGTISIERTKIKPALDVGCLKVMFAS